MSAEKLAASCIPLLNIYIYIIFYFFLREMKVIELKSYTKYKDMYQMKNASFYMVLRGR
jgi:hypothetical protein